MVLIRAFKQVKKYAESVRGLEYAWEELEALNTKVDNLVKGILPEGTISLSELATAVVDRLIPTGGITNSNVATNAAIAKTKLAALDIGDADIAAAGISKGVDGTGEGYTIALVTAAFGDPATLADGQTFIYRDTSGNKTYGVSVYDGVFYGVEKAAVPSGE